MAASTLASVTVAAPDPPSGTHSPRLRPAGVAGGFYPADPATLVSRMDEM
jgi:hypothetical protein